MEETERRSTRFSRRSLGGDVVTEKETVTTDVKESCDLPMQEMKHHHHNEGVRMGWGWSLGAIVLWFIVLTVFIWLILFSLRPSWVLVSGSQEVNLARVLGISLLIALVLMILIALICWAVSAATHSRY